MRQLQQPEGGKKLGMCMSLQLFARPLEPSARQDGAALLLAVGYEAGHVAIWDVSSPMSAPLAVARLHEEPVLCLIIDAAGTGVQTLSTA